MPPIVKWLLHEHEDLSWDPQHLEHTSQSVQLVCELQVH